MTLTRRIPPEEVLAKGHIPFLILYGGEEEEVTPEEDEQVEEGERIESEQHLVRKKRYVEISVDQNSFPNHILPASLGASQLSQLVPNAPLLKQNLSEDSRFPLGIAASPACFASPLPKPKRL